jgi:LPXTG-motif cell wall-anchored protein
MGKAPTSFGGVDLIGLLLPLQQDNGRFVDSSSFGDFLNALGQSFAVIALERTGDHDAEAAKAADYLISVQCDDGGFPLTLPAKPGDPCDSQVDATAMVTQALLAEGQTKAANAGLDWLAGKQKSNGGFDDDAATNTLPVNSNSTGLAAAALRIGGHDDAADKAVAFLLGMQQGCTTKVAQHGAIAYDSKGFEQSTATRATTQALLGLGGANLAKLSADGISPAAPTLACPSPSPTPSGPSPSPTSEAGLPVTGASLTPVVVIGAALVLAGAVLLLLLRRRRDVTQF